MHHTPEIMVHDTRENSSSFMAVVNSNDERDDTKNMLNTVVVRTLIASQSQVKAYLRS